MTGLETSEEDHHLYPGTIIASFIRWTLGITISIEVNHHTTSIIHTTLHDARVHGQHTPKAPTFRLQPIQPQPNLHEIQQPKLQVVPRCLPDLFSAIRGQELFSNLWRKHQQLPERLFPRVKEQWIGQRQMYKELCISGLVLLSAGRGINGWLWLMYNWLLNYPINILALLDSSFISIQQIETGIRTPLHTFSQTLCS